MHAETRDPMRTALRQAAAIAAVDGSYTIKQRLSLASDLYDALLLLPPGDRARRIHLIDMVFPPSTSRR